ncbi:hypothetical protein [Streptomyces olivochromogenes]|uniref:hypothetical protein n=1 Tax=Streptomyces olivochromogenes TaxID=1963 RepID=UPI001F305109|nr:hypothetical protein [Streptomyces olivochromogenes]MCF3128931.1 hypothetical protein [Streptomyces olivochromogenes]
MSRPTTRATRLTVLALGVTAGVTLTACGGGSDDGAADKPTTSASPTPRGVVTKEKAKELLDTYEQVNNRANKAHDEKLLATVEGGQVHEQSKADYRLMSTWSAKERKGYGSPFFYRDREYYLPSSGTWFAVKARPSSDPKDEALLVFEKEGSTYKMVSSAYTATGSIPKIAVDRNGLATVADPSTKVGAYAPDQLGAAYEDFFETGGKKAGKRFATTEATKGSLKVYADRNDGEAGRWSNTSYFAAKPAHPTVYALKLADGGVLALFPTAHTQEQLLKPAYRSSFQINPSKTEAVYNPAKRTVVTDTFQGLGLAELPSAGKPDVTTIEYRMVDSR